MLIAVPARATDTLEALVSVLHLPKLIGVMREEGLRQGEDIRQDLFEGRAAPGWSQAVSRAHDAEAMLDTLKGGLERGMTLEQMDASVAFFRSTIGARIVDLEVSARQARLDETVEEASIRLLEQMQADGAPRLALLEEFSEANDLVEANVAGALNSNYAFLRGMSDGGAFGEALTEGWMLRETWVQEPEIRAETREWVLSYLAMAYASLSEEDLRRYLEFSGTPAGRALNAALFSGYEEMFVAISYKLGLAVARDLAGDDT
ncbi:hypothetical protein CCR78_03085 [Rhodovulum imhoffii]|nr:hypothetical protein [Rhodovulum imhoffii]